MKPLLAHDFATCTTPVPTENPQVAKAARRLIVVSNRVARPAEKRAGGLAAALQGALQERGGMWFGWSGEVGSASDIHRERDGEVAYATMDLNRRDYQDYYSGFANRALWPLLHYRPDLVDCQRSQYEGYVRVNALFADRLLPLITDDDTVWIHDYHLIPLAGMLRQRGFSGRIGFFLHTPLPPPELLRILPMHEELLDSFTACDVVGVHTARDLRALRDYFVRQAGATLDADGTLAVGTRRFHAAAFPISIDTQAAIAIARKAATSRSTRRLQESLDGRALVIGVDRLDYSKGLPQRFDAFARLLQDNASLRNHVSMLQIAPPSRSEVPEYRQIRRELERRAGHLNGALAEPDWIPLRYINQTLPYATLAGYYRLARVGLVTPMRDGMNLVAKEYVACQDPDDPGVLVLSRFAGAAEELHGALLVNPHDLEGMACGLQQALAMPLAERQQRWRTMMAVLEINDIAAWRQAFLQALVGHTQGLG